jgi:signal transduction histidine kinase
VILDHAYLPIVMTIFDNGIGFDPAQLKMNEHVGLGILNMFEMAEVAGGKLLLESNLGKGTCIVVKI